MKKLKKFWKDFDAFLFSFYLCLIPLLTLFTMCIVYVITGPLPEAWLNAGMFSQLLWFTPLIGNIIEEYKSNNE